MLIDVITRTFLDVFLPSTLSFPLLNILLNIDHLSKDNKNKF